MTTPEPLISTTDIYRITESVCFDDATVSVLDTHRILVIVRDEYEDERTSLYARLAVLRAEIAEAQGERDAALFALMQHNPDALAGDLLGWVADAKRRLAKVKPPEDEATS